MSFRLSNSRWYILLTLLGVCGLQAGSAQAQSKQHGRPIEFSQPRSTEVLTNLDQLNSKQGSLKQLEDELKRSLQPFPARNSLDDSLALPYRAPAAPVIQNTRVKDYLERRKNWMNLSPDDMMMMLGGPGFDIEDKEKKKGPSLDKFYEDLNRQRFRGMNPGMPGNDDSPAAFKPPGMRDGLGAPGDPNLPTGIKQNEHALRKMLSSDSGNVFAPAPGRSTAGDFFGLGIRPPSREETLAHKAYLEQYQQLLNGGPPVSAAPANLPGLADAPRRAAPSTGLDSLGGSSRREKFDASPGAIHSLLNPTALPDANAKTLNQWNPMYTPPKPEPPKAKPAFTPPAEAPLRPFL
jgi:hypothetical protein